MLSLVPASAGAYIYWGSYGGGDSSIGRADLTAANANYALVTGIYFGGSVGSDGSHIYWGESGNGSEGAIGRANADGSNPEHRFLGSGTSGGVCGNKATAAGIFWLRCNGTIERDGPSGFQTIGGGEGTCGFAVDETHVYWSHNRYIGRALLDGSSPEPNWIFVGESQFPCGVAVDTSHVYWTSPNPTEASESSMIGRANIDGSEVLTNFITGVTFEYNEASGIAVSGDFLYWTNQPVGEGNFYGSIGRAGINGVGGVDVGFIPGVKFPIGLDVDTGGPPPAPPTPPGPPAPRNSPVGVNLGGAGASNPTFSVGRGSTPTSLAVGAGPPMGVPVGTVFFYTVNQSASVKIALVSRKGGRHVKGKCAKPTKKNAERKKCDRTVATLSRTATSGRNEVPFSGRIKGKALAPGRYVAIFTAIGPGGSSAAVPVDFRIVTSPGRSPKT